MGSTPREHTYCYMHKCKVMKYDTALPNFFVISAVHSYTDMYSSKCFNLLNKYNISSLSPVSNCCQSQTQLWMHHHFYWLYHCPVILFLSLFLSMNYLLLIFFLFLFFIYCYFLSFICFINYLLLFHFLFFLVIIFLYFLLFSFFLCCCYYLFFVKY